MSVYKDATRNSWYVKIRYTDYYGKKKQTTKRGIFVKMFYSTFFSKKIICRHNI